MDSRKDRQGREQKHFKKHAKKVKQSHWNWAKNKPKSNGNSNNKWKLETNENTTNEKES